MNASPSSELPKRMRCERTSRPLRIALVYSRIPFPMMRGDQLTVAHLISYLAARGHAVDLYTLDVQGQLTTAQQQWMQAHCRTVNIYKQPMAGRVTGALRGLAARLPVQVGMFRNSHLREDLRRAVEAGGYDVVHCYYIRSAPDIPVDLTIGRNGNPPGKVRTAAFLAMQLSQTLNSKRIRDNEKGTLKKLFYRSETALCAHYESRVWQEFTRSVLIGPADVAAVEEVCRSEGQPRIDNWVYGAHGTDTDKFQPAVTDEIVPGRVVFSGSMLYQPNIQAALWFVEHCWPSVRARHPAAHLIIQGRDPSPAIRDLDGRDGITVTGTVPDVGVMIRSAAVCINPVLAAGGMQNKLIEYMASNKAVVATSIANEGIMAPAETLVIADQPATFSQAVVDLLDAPDRARALGEKARSYVLENWTWEAHFEKLEAAFRDALDAGQAR